MTLLRRLTLVWPGLPGLWLRGSRSGLVLALALAALLDVCTLATFIWSELFDAAVLVGLWAAVAAVWGAGTVVGWATFPEPLPAPGSTDGEALFQAARDAYLARDWLAAETRLRELLDLSPTDGEAQLLLATLWRRAGRQREARAALEALSRSDAGGPWAAEIERERRLILAAETAPAEVSGLPTRQPDTAPARRAA